MKFLSGVFHYKKVVQNKTFMFKRYNLLYPMKVWAKIILWLINTKATSRSYSVFQSFQIFVFKEKRFAQLCPKNNILVKNTQRT